MKIKKTIRNINKLFDDSFYRFLFGFTTIIALSFGMIVVSSMLIDSSALKAAVSNIFVY